MRVLRLAGDATQDLEKGVVWLHGTMRVAIAEAEHVPLHKHLHCQNPVTQGLDSCLGFIGNRRFAHAYVTMEIGPARRYALSLSSPLMSRHNKEIEGCLRSIPTLEDQGCMPFRRIWRVNLFMP